MQPGFFPLRMKAASGPSEDMSLDFSDSFKSPNSAKSFCDSFDGSVSSPESDYEKDAQQELVTRFCKLKSPQNLDEGFDSKYLPFERSNTKDQIVRDIEWLNSRCNNDEDLKIMCIRLSGIKDSNT